MADEVYIKLGNHFPPLSSKGPIVPGKHRNGKRILSADIDPNSRAAKLQREISGQVPRRRFRGTYWNAMSSRQKQIEPSVDCPRLDPDIPEPVDLDPKKYDPGNKKSSKSTNLAKLASDPPSRDQPATSETTAHQAEDEKSVERNNCDETSSPKSVVQEPGKSGKAIFFHPGQRFTASPTSQNDSAVSVQSPAARTQDLVPYSHNAQNSSNSTAGEENSADADMAPHDDLYRHIAGMNPHGLPRVRPDNTNISNGWNQHVHMPSPNFANLDDHTPNFAALAQQFSHPRGHGLGGTGLGLGSGSPAFQIGHEQLQSPFLGDHLAGTFHQPSPDLSRYPHGHPGASHHGLGESSLGISADYGHARNQSERRMRDHDGNRTTRFPGTEHVSRAQPYRGYAPSSSEEDDGPDRFTPSPHNRAEYRTSDPPHPIPADHFSGEDAQFNYGSAERESSQSYEALPRISPSIPTGFGRSEALPHMPDPRVTARGAYRPDPSVQAFVPWSRTAVEYRSVASSVAGNAYDFAAPPPHGPLPPRPHDRIASEVHRMVEKEYARQERQAERNQARSHPNGYYTENTPSGFDHLGRPYRGATRPADAGNNVSQEQAHFRRMQQMQTQQMQTQQMQAEQMHTEQMQTQQMQAEQMQTEQMQTEQMQAEQMQTEQMQAQQMRARQIQAQKNDQEKKAEIKAEIMRQQALRKFEQHQAQKMSHTVYDDPRTLRLPFMQPSQDGWTPHFDDFVNAGFGERFSQGATLQGSPHHDNLATPTRASGRGRAQQREHMPIGTQRQSNETSGPPSSKSKVKFESPPIEDRPSSSRRLNSEVDHTPRSIGLSNVKSTMRALSPTRIAASIRNRNRAGSATANTVPESHQISRANTTGGTTTSLRSALSQGSKKADSAGTVASLGRSNTGKSQASYGGRLDSLDSPTRHWRDESDEFRDIEAAAMARIGSPVPLYVGVPQNPEKHQSSRAELFQAPLNMASKASRRAEYEDYQEEEGRVGRGLSRGESYPARSSSLARGDRPSLMSGSGTRSRPQSPTRSPTGHGYGRSRSVSPVKVSSFGLGSRSRSRSPFKATSTGAMPFDIDDDDDDSDQPPEVPPKPKLPNPPMKQMFGEKGWLDRGAASDHLAGQKNKTGWKNLATKMKQKADSMRDEFVQKAGVAMRGKDGSPEKTITKPAKNAHHISNFPITLDYGEQMRLFGEIDLLLTTMANIFLMSQKSMNHVSVESVQKVTKQWAGRNRAQIIEFRFNLATQLELIKLNMASLEFYGPEAKNWMRQAAMLNGWKDIARELGVRSFCSADSAVKKLLSDSYVLLEMMGATTQQFLLLQKLHVSALRKIESAAEARALQEKTVYGVTRPFIPPTTEGPGAGGKTD